MTWTPEGLAEAFAAAVRAGEQTDPAQFIRRASPPDPARTARLILRALTELTPPAPTEEELERFRETDAGRRLVAAVKHVAPQLAPVTLDALVEQHGIREAALAADLTQRLDLGSEYTPAVAR